MRNVVTQFAKFSGVGAIGTAAHYLTLVSLVEGLQLQPVLASSAGALVGALVNYILNYHYTFRSDQAHLSALTKFLTIATIGFVLNGLLMSLLAIHLGMHYLLAQVITTALVLVWNFLGNRLWTFRTTTEKARGAP
jgi:putative flippase GtrA